MQVMTFRFPLLIGYLVFVMASRAGTTELHTASPCCYPVGRGRLVSCYNTYGRPRTKVRIVFHARWAPFYWFRKKWQRIAVAIKGFIVCPHLTHHAFPVTVTNGCPSGRSLTHFSVYFIYCWTFSRPEYTWNSCAWPLRNHQSINQSVLVITINLVSMQPPFIDGSSCCPYKHRSQLAP
jgi:hypothetical protein